MSAPLTTAASINRHLLQIRTNPTTLLGKALEKAFDSNLASVCAWPEDGGQVSYIQVSSVQALTQAECDIIRAAIYYAAGLAGCDVPASLTIIRTSCR